MLTKVQSKAARLLAEGWLTAREIAVRCEVDRRTLNNWRKLPEFSGRIDDLRRAYAEKIKSNGVADLLNRIRASNMRWRKMMRLANQVRNLEDFDPSLMKSLLDHEKHVAEQLGQLGIDGDDAGEELTIRVRPVKKRANDIDPA